MGRLQRILSLEDFEPAARRHLPGPVFAYVNGGVEDGRATHDNRAAFDELGFIPRNVVDVSRRTTETTLFGERQAAPFGIAPMGISALSAYRGDLVQARAARDRGIPMIMSGSSLMRMEDVVAECPATWFQAYLPGEPARIAALVERVAAAGFGTLVLTVDAQIQANRENNVRAGFSTPLRPSLRLAWDGLTHPRWLFGTALRTLLNHGLPHFENSYRERGVPIISANVLRDFGTRDHLTWEHVRQVRQQWRGRLVIKGVMAVADGVNARDAGADA
ncbi:MAG: alpha-hydroxy acid oxidase, partial [Rubrivivax sp.]|nr:alpha-hydroxy acid oxidase [Rubrivivax sp.]